MGCAGSHPILSREGGRAERAIPGLLPLLVAVSVGKLTGCTGRKDPWNAELTGVIRTEQFGKSARTHLVSIANSYPESSAAATAVADVERFGKLDPAARTKAHRDWWHGYYSRSYVAIPDKSLESLYWQTIYRFGCGTRTGRYYVDCAGIWFQGGGRHDNRLPTMKIPGTRPEALLLLAAGCVAGLPLNFSSVLGGETPPETAIVTVDFSRKDGKIRALNGANLAPPLAVQASGLNLNTSYKALKIPYARLHDVPLDNPGMRLVDIQHIFGNWEADASDPKNYYFEQTDDYIRNCRELGTDIIFRLGTSIEHSVNHYYAHPPKDFEKWTEICLNIIRHYNEGWANGHHWNIRYWEIWNEPNIKRQMWSGTMEDYYRLYVTSAKRIKSEFPDLKVGGPASIRA